MKFFLLIICLSFSIFAVDEVSFDKIKVSKARFKQKGRLIDGDIIILDFPEKASIHSREAYNFTELCGIDYVNMTKISKIEASFKKGYNKKVKCFNRKGKIFYEKNVLSEDSVEAMKYGIDGILDQKRVENGKTVEYTSFYKNGNILKERKYINGLREGVWKEYYIDGSIKSIIKFKKGKAVNIERFERTG